MSVGEFWQRVNLKRRKLGMGLVNGMLGGDVSEIITAGFFLKDLWSKF